MGDVKKNKSDATDWQSFVSWRLAWCILLFGGCRDMELVDQVIFSRYLSVQGMRGRPQALPIFQLSPSKAHIDKKRGVKSSAQVNRIGC